MGRKSKRELEESQREYKIKTDSEIKISGEVVDDGDTARTEFNDQQEPSLTETADALNKVSEELRSDIREQHEKQVEKVIDAVDIQRKEISEPAREVEDIEGKAADTLDIASSGNKRFGKFLSDAADSRRDAEAFHRELAEKDEKDQEETRENIDDQKGEVDRIIGSIKEL
jgi:hypothetical protein